MKYKISILGLLDKSNMEHPDFGNFASFLNGLAEGRSKTIILEDKWVVEVVEE